MNMHMNMQMNMTMNMNMNVSMNMNMNLNIVTPLTLEVPDDDVNPDNVTIFIKVHKPTLHAMGLWAGLILDKG